MGTLIKGSCLVLWAQQRYRAYRRPIIEAGWLRKNPKIIRPRKKIPLVCGWLRGRRGSIFFLIELPGWGGEEDDDRQQDVHDARSCPAHVQGRLLDCRWWQGDGSLPSPHSCFMLLPAHEKENENELEIDLYIYKFTAVRFLALGF